MKGAMFDFFTHLLDTSAFSPRWSCGNWTAGHGWLHILSDVGVWSAHLTIPCVLAYFLLRRKDFPFRTVLWLFGAFILACGTTHLMEALVFWWPVYRLVGLIKLFTALVSWATVFALVPIVPQVLAMRSPEELEREIAHRRRAEADLAEANQRLCAEIAERKTAVEAIRSSETLFQGLFRVAPDAVFVTGLDGRIRQVNLQAEKYFGYRRDELIGRPLETLVPFPAVARRKDGSEFPVDVSQAPLHTPEGVVVLSNVRNIAHRKANEDILRARSRQQSALAGLAQRSLQLTDFSAIAEEATAMVARTLDADLCDVRELLPDEEGSQAAYCLQTEGPVVVADLRSEQRFTPAPALLRRGAVSGVSVVIPCPGRPCSELSVWATRARQFTVEDVVFVQAVAHLLTAARRRTEAQDQIKAALVEKELLLKEIHHRVKNNLQVISALLDLQAGYTEDGPAAEMFRESRNRVRSMALVHERLYRSPDLARVDFADYIDSLVRHLFQTYRANGTGIRLELDISPEVGLPLDTAVPCALLVNELVSNCFKHAFTGEREGVLGIVLRALAGDRLLLCVADDGVGLPEGVQLESSETFGLQLVVMLMKQLKGTVEILRTGGTTFRLTFPLAQRRADFRGGRINDDSPHSRR
jgi:two-component sensor histidine kinase